jgi:hypothetical protein
MLRPALAAMAALSLRHRLAHAGLARDGFCADARSEPFNVHRDPAEQRDLAAEQPARVETLARRFVEEARRTLVLPAP